MLQSVYQILSIGMKYWFLMLAIFIVSLLISVSKKEYREKKVLLGEIGQYIGYIEFIRGVNGKALNTRIGIADENTIGRSKNADIIIRDSSVQKNHVFIYRDGSRVIMEPLVIGRTRINGRRADNPYEIHTGDILDIGRVSVRVFIRPEVEAVYDEIQE